MYQTWKPSRMKAEAKLKTRRMVRHVCSFMMD